MNSGNGSSSFLALSDFCRRRGPRVHVFWWSPAECDRRRHRRCCLDFVSVTLSLSLSLSGSVVESVSHTVGYDLNRAPAPRAISFDRGA
jgi:hypothetical protein